MIFYVRLEGEGDSSYRKMSSKEKVNRFAVPQLLNGERIRVKTEKGVELVLRSLSDLFTNETQPFGIGVEVPNTIARQILEEWKVNVTDNDIWWIGGNRPIHKEALINTLLEEFKARTQRYCVNRATAMSWVNQWGELKKWARQIKSLNTQGKES